MSDTLRATAQVDIFQNLPVQKRYARNVIWTLASFDRM